MRKYSRRWQLFNEKKIVRTCQQESGTFAPTHEPAQEPMQNNQLSTIEEEAQTQQLTHVEKNVDAVNHGTNGSHPDAFDTMYKLSGTSGTRDPVWTIK